MLIQEILINTIQGEGHWQGTRADFVRLFGCPVGCSWCDTGYADGGGSVSFTDIPIPEIVQQLASPHVVITGGEPFLNKELNELIKALSGHFVSIETSGVRYQEVPDNVWVTLSPKTHETGKAVARDHWFSASELKIVIQSVADFEYYYDQVVMFRDTDRPVCVQPCARPGVSDSEALEPCLAVLKEHPWVKLSVQLHKILGLP